MNWLTGIGLGFATAIMVSLIMWMIALWTNASVLDATWGIANALVAVVYTSWTIMTRGHLSLVPLLTVVLALVWGIRLTGFVVWRNRRLGGRTSTYGRRYPRQPGLALRLLLNISLVQILSVFIVSLPFLFIQQQGSTITPLVVVGVIVWGVGAVLETIADQQLFSFKAEPANHGLRLMTGVWGISRHPNYFGEALVWWGFFFFALATPFGWMAVLSPVLMTTVMGMTAFSDRGVLGQTAETDRYRQSVSAFLPWFPRHI